MLRILGAIDPHTHLRDMDWSHKGTFATETAAALAGGFTAVLDMPNTPPPTVDRAALRIKLNDLSERSRCDYGVWLGADPRVLLSEVTLRNLARHVCGWKLYCGDTTGELEINKEKMEHCVQLWPGPGPLGLHAEDEDIIVHFIQELKRHRKRGHICHIHSKAAVHLLAAAKENGVNITAGVTPHHLFLTDRDCTSLGAAAVMKPLLGDSSDRDALWQGLLSGVIDMVETDHAPHVWQEKQGKSPAYGVPGLDTCLPLLCTAVAEGRMPVEMLPEVISTAPRRVFGLPRASFNTYTLIDTDVRWTITSGALATQCGWSPFEGMKVQGLVRRVVVRGEVVFADGEVLAQPGSGVNLYTR